MFVRSVSAGGARYLHAVAQRRLAAGGAAATDGVRDLAAQAEWTLAKRVVCRTDGRADVLYQARAPADDATRLAAVFAQLGDEGFRLPRDDGEFEAWLVDAPAARAGLDPQPFCAGDLRFACPLRATHLWPRLLAAGVRGRCGVGYQTNLYTHRPSTAVLRAWALNLDRVHLRPGVPPQLADVQSRLGEVARRGRWLAEEIVMVDATAIADGVQDDVDRLFRGRYDDIGGGPRLAFADRACSEPLSLACDHDDGWAADPVEVAARAVDRDAAIECLDFQPDADAWRSARPALAMPPRVEADAAPYVFISYARVDTAAMRRVRDGLIAAGVPVWVDEQLQGGEEWDAVLESRIRGCALLLVLMSPAAAASKFVRRELRYADATGRRLLCYRLGDAELTDGMAMLLLPLQWIDDTQDGARQQLVAAVRRWLGG